MSALTPEGAVAQPAGLQGERVAAIGRCLDTLASPLRHSRERGNPWLRDAELAAVCRVPLG